MFDLWLSSGSVGIVLIPFIVLYLIAVLIVWVTHKSPARLYFASCVGITGPFFTSVAILFALFAAFLANDVQRRNTQAQSAVFREAEGIRTILRLSEALGEHAEPVKRAALGYLQFVLNEELPAMRRTRLHCRQPRRAADSRPSPCWPLPSRHRPRRRSRRRCFRVLLSCRRRDWSALRWQET